ncbi:unnamed protein product [Rhodiola kirilowii]
MALLSSTAASKRNLAPSISPGVLFSTSKLSRNSRGFQFPNNSFTNRRMSMSTTSSVVKAAADVRFDAEVASDVATSTHEVWAEFSEKVSGEWDGYGADFTVDGKPMELPEYVVPEAYKEWEVKVFDWQTQCPTLAQKAEEDASLFYKLIKLLPTVGCEADAATRYTIDERNVGGERNGVAAFAYQGTGSYVAIWPGEEKPGMSKMLELEHCLVDPRNKEVRVRVVQVVSVDNLKFVLRNIRVFCEQWYGPFRNGDQLGGCSIRDSSFAATDALKGSLVNGVWRISSAIANFEIPSHKCLQGLLGERLHENVRNEKDLIFLPRQLWCSLKETENGGTYGEVGWLLDQGQAITSRCIFSSDSKLKEVLVSTETLVPEA